MSTKGKNIVFVVYTAIIAYGFTKTVKQNLSDQCEALKKDFENERKQRVERKALNERLAGDNTRRVSWKVHTTKPVRRKHLLD